MKRSSYFVLALVLVVGLVLTACGPAAAPATDTVNPAEPTTKPVEQPAQATDIPAAVEPEPFDWQARKGDKLRVAMVSQPWTQFLEPYIPEFKELTGIDVTFEILPEDQFRQKTTTEFMAGTSDVDVFLSMAAQEGIRYESAGWYEDIGALAANPQITDPDFDLGDFTTSGLGTATLSNGKLIGLPVYLEFGSLMMNKALFEEAGVPYPPQTLEDVEKAAAAITNKDDGIYGWCARGKGAAGTSQFASVMYAFGSGWVTSDGKANLLDPKWLDAMAWYGNMINKYGPPGASAIHWQQCQDLVLQGKVGMWLDASVFFANLLDPSVSTIAESAGIAVAPQGPGGRNPHVASWHVSIYSQSKNKEAAWLFLQWALGKEMVLKAQLANITTVRTSAWESPDFQKVGNQELIDAFTYAMQNGNPGWNPPVLAVGEARDAIGVVIITAHEGGDFKAEAAKANAKLQELIDATPQLK